MLLAHPGHSTLATLPGSSAWGLLPWQQGQLRKEAWPVGGQPRSTVAQLYFSRLKYLCLAAAYKRQLPVEML